MYFLYLSCTKCAHIYNKSYTIYQLSFGFLKKIDMATSHVAELWGVLEGLQLAKLREFPKVELQIDSGLLL